jgi:hypothetical protein
MHPPEPNRGNLILRFGFVTLLVLIVGWLLLRGLVGRSVKDVADALEPAVDRFDSSQLTAFIGVEMPESATDFHGVANSFMQSRVIGVRFRIPHPDTNEFLMALGFKLPLESNMNPFHPNSVTLSGNNWWTPEAAKTFVGGSFTKSESFYDVLVDTTDAESYVIYLMVEQG